MLRAEDHEELRWLAELAACKGWWEARRADPAAQPDEVDQTFRLMRWTTRYLAELWKPVFQRRKVAMRISGVFCHKTPLATFRCSTGVDETCELGDLLVVHDRLGREPRRRAALMQAKRTLGGTAKSPDEVQNDLYRRFPPFKLSRKGHKGTRFKKGLRHVGPVDDLARFALVADDADVCFWTDVDDHWFWHPSYGPGRPPWSVAHPRQVPVTSVGAETFGSFLSSMLFDTHPARGQTVQEITDLASATLGTGQDLDITVQELLDLTAKRVANSKQKWGGLPRGVVAFQDGTLPLPNPGNPFRDFPSLSEVGEPPDVAVLEGDEDGEGMPVLFIETFGD